MLRPLRVGWLKHNHIGIAWGVNPVSDEEIRAVTKKRKQRLVVDQELMEAHVVVPEYLDAVWDFPDGNFGLFHRGRQIGIGFKKTDGTGHVRLYWLKLRDLMRLSRTWEPRVMEALARHRAEST